MKQSKSFEIAFARWWFLHMDGSARRRIWLKLAKLINNGVPILRSLQSMQERRRASHGASDGRAIAMEYWITGVQNGRHLSEMLDSWVTPVEKMLIASGELTGTLEQSLTSAARVMEAQSEIRGAVWRGLAYPTILLAVVFAVLYLFGFKVVPEFTKIVPPERFHGLASFLIGMSDFARNWLFATAAVIVSCVIAFFVSLPRWDGSVRIFLDRYAPFSIYRVVVGSTWLISIAAMLEAGVRMEDALRHLSTIASPWLRTRIQAASHSMRSGLSLGDALSRNGYEFPDREIIDDLGVYSSLSGFDEALSMLGREWLTESVVQIKAKMAVVFGASLLAVALLIGVTVSGMMTMQLQMSAAIQQKVR